MFQKEAFLWEVSLSESLLWQSLLRSFCPCGVTAKRENIPAAVPAAAVRTPATVTAAHKNTDRNPQNNETSP